MLHLSNVVYLAVKGPYSDIYNFGLVLAGATIGRPLDMGNSMDTAYQARLKIPDLNLVPAEFRPQLTAILQPNPADRPQDMAELLRRMPSHANSKRVLVEKKVFWQQGNIRWYSRKTAMGKRKPRWMSSPGLVCPLLSNYRKVLP
jgi:hypothetical protein